MPVRLHTRPLYVHFTEEARSNLPSHVREVALVPGIVEMRPTQPVRPSRLGALHYYAMAERDQALPALAAIKSLPSVKNAYTLHRMFLVRADVASDLDAVFEGLKKIETVENVLPLSHMEAMDQPDEVSFNVFAVPYQRHGGDLVRDILAVPGIKPNGVDRCGLAHQ